MMTGRLIYLMGPSGSGKDSLLEAVRERALARNCRIARRVITRSSEAIGEDALGVSPERFDQLRNADAFALHWQANGLRYGIPRQIDDWLAQGCTVLVNGSRAHLAAARRRYPELTAVLVVVDPAVLRERLLARGRERLPEIEARLARNALLPPPGDCLLLDNSGALTDAAARLLRLVEDAACA